MHHIILYEDHLYPELYPLTYLRPVWDLKCGAFSLKQRLEKGVKSAVIYQWTSRERSAFSNRIEIGKGPLLLVNGRAFISQKDLSTLLKSKGKAAVTGEGFIAALKLDDASGLGKVLSSDPDESILLKLAEGAKEISSSAKMFRHLWELVDHNSQAIAQDAGYFKGSSLPLPKGSYLLGKRSDLKSSAQAFIEPGSVIDTRQGPVIIEAGAVIRPFSRIEGPCYIGPDSLIDGAKLRPGVSVGRGCKLAGEVEETVVLDFSNKHHDGFLGHSYLGSWVNLGAQTCNSDLKNNYGNIVVWANGKHIDSGRIKAGCFIGDHSKTAIGTMINTGTVVGIGCNIFGGPVKKYLPSFSWGCSDLFHDHKLEKVLATCRMVMARRKMEMPERDAELMKKIFEATARDRENISGGK
ncbi:MAG: putative sugar nucleotidyl transferase [Candidatus Edwardsbacteria bacterium]|nr:putative sugar nucleotidyl transferase [Candidatus Edwardsbacteria bacterium]